MELDPCLLDTTAFAPLPRQARERAALSRPASGVLVAQTPSVPASRTWGTGVLDRDGVLRRPWQGQAGWRLGREHLAVRSWYGFAAGPDAPLEDWRATAAAVLAGGGTYALASQAQTWWADGADVAPPVVDLPAVLLWGGADRSHRAAGTDPEQLRDLLPRLEVRHVDSAGHFVDTEAPEALLDAWTSLIG